MGDQLPVHAEGSGGRQADQDPDKYGNIYDHFACAHQLESGHRRYHFSMKQNGTVGIYDVELYGAKGACSAENGHTILTGNNAWRYRCETNDMH